jgi:uncharacterized protein YbaR (Trm112 family)
MDMIIMERKFLSLLIMVTCLGAMSGELYGMQGDSNPAVVNLRGYLPCSNYQRCGSPGLYPAQHLGKALCDSCEFAAFPGNFVACPVCRRPQRKMLKETQCIFCNECKSCLEDKLPILLVPKDVTGHSQYDLITGAIVVYLRRLMVSRNYIEPFFDPTIYRKFKRQYDKNTLIIYKGAKKLENGNLLHVWQTELTIEPADIRIVSNAGRAGAYIDNIFTKYNILGVQTGETLHGNISENNILYEEEPLGRSVGY